MTHTAQRHYRTGIAWLIGSGIVILSGVGALAFWFRPSSEAIAIQLVEVERGDVVKTIQAGGMVKLGNQQTLTAATTANNTAIIDRIAVNINSPITAGQMLLTLRNPEGRAQIEAQRLTIEQERQEIGSKQREVQNQELQLEKARRSQRTLAAIAEAVDNARLALSNAQAERETQRQELPDLEEKVRTTAALVEQGYLATDELRQAEQALRQGRANLASRERAVEQAQLTLTTAQQQRQQALADQRDNVTSQALTLETNRQGVTTSLQKLTAAEVSLQRSIETFENSSLIRATTAGRVLAIHAREGDVVEQGKQLITIGDPRREEVEIQLTTLDAPLVKLAQKATVAAIGIVAGEFPARVVAIAASDDLEAAAIELDPQTLTAVSLAQRPDYLTSLLTLNLASLDLQEADHARRWQLDLETRYADATSQRSDFTAQLILTQPLGERSRRQEAFERSRIARLKQENDLAQRETDIRIEIENQVRQVRLQWEQLQLARRQVELASQELTAQEALIQAGQGDAFRLQDAQRELLAVRNAELAQRVNYSNALTQLDEIQGITLERWGIQLDPAR